MVRIRHPDLGHVVDANPLGLERLRLGDRSRETVEQEPRRAVRLGQTLLHQPHNDLVRHQLAGIHHSQGGINGGIGGCNGEPNRVTFYAQVDDLQAYLSKAESLGGTTVLPPTEIPDVVTIAMFSDPEGNVIGLVKDQA